MKKTFIAVMIGGISCIALSEEIVIYGPSSMKWIEKKYAPYFKEKTGDSIKFIPVSNLVSKLTLEKKNPKADIVVGMTELTAEIGKNNNLIVEYQPKNIGNIVDKKYKMASNYIIPMDYGMLGFNYNKNMIKNPPKSLAEFKNFNKQLLLENPKFSVTGEELIQWSIALYGNEWLKFWEQLKPAIYSVEKGWSEAFTKFTTLEAPMMAGYVTSNLFFEGESSYLDTFLIEDGSYIYQEGASLVNKKEIKEGAKKFMENILTPEFQKLIVEENYMFPVIKMELDEKFQSLPKAENSVKLSQEQIKILAKDFEKYKNELNNFLKR